MKSDRKAGLYSVKNDTESYSLFITGLILIMLPGDGEAISA